MLDIRIEEYQWHKVADSIEEINFSSNNMAEFVIDGKHLCIIKYGSTLVACIQKCPHAGGIMSNGYVDTSGNIVCPMHGYKFSLKNGRNVTGEGYILKIFPVQIRSNAVFIGIVKLNL